MLLNCGVREDSSEFHGLQVDQTSQSYKQSILKINWKDWWWSWSSNTLAALCEELTHWIYLSDFPWCWERLKGGGKGDDRGWDGWMASPTQWTWVWANSRWYWRTQKPGVSQSMVSYRVGHDWVTEQPPPPPRLPRWLSDKEAACQSKRCRRRGSNPWVVKIPWSRKWQPTAIFLLGKLHGQRSLAVCCPWGCKELDMTEQLSMHALPKNKSIHLFKKHTATLN